MPRLTYAYGRKILHDPELYSDPMTFNPGRFIAPPDKEAERDPRDFAFGFGRRFDFRLRHVPLPSLTVVTPGNALVYSSRKPLSSWPLSRRLPYTTFRRRPIPTVTSSSPALSLQERSSGTYYSFAGPGLLVIDHCTQIILSHPAPFQCKITVRSDKAQALLDGIRDRASESS